MYLPVIKETVQILMVHSKVHSFIKIKMDAP